MKRFHLVFSILVTLVFAGISLPQETVDPEWESHPKNPKNTIKVDEFGPINGCDLGARVDNLFIQLNNRPEALGYVIGYAGSDSLPSQIESMPMVTRILKTLAFGRHDPDRLVIINGGFRESMAIEFYLVPPGGEIPQPTATVPAPQPPTGTFLWSRSWIAGTEEMPDVLFEFVLPEVRARQEEEERAADLKAEREAQMAEDDAKSKEAAFTEAPDNPERASSEETPVVKSSVSIGIEAPVNGRDPLTLVKTDETGAVEPATEEIELDEPYVEERTPEEIEAERFSWTDGKFGPEIARRKGARGVIIFYADDQYYDIGRLLPFIEQGRDRIAAAAGLRPDQIRVIFGGYRDGTEAEYYIVPKGGKAPEPTPGERPVEEPVEVPDSTDDQQVKPTTDNSQ